MKTKIYILIIIVCIILSIFFIVQIVKNNSSQNHHVSSTNLVSEIEAFNNNFENFRGKQSGSKVSRLANKIILVTNEYKDEPNKIPSVTCSQISSYYPYSVNLKSDSFEQNNYINEVTKIKSYIEKEHTYTITFEYSDLGFISNIDILY